MLNWPHLGIWASALVEAFVWWEYWSDVIPERKKSSPFLSCIIVHSLSCIYICCNYILIETLSE